MLSYLTSLSRTLINVFNRTFEQQTSTYRMSGETKMPYGELRLSCTKVPLKPWKPGG
jgi:hypothetical protein